MKGQRWKTMVETEEEEKRVGEGGVRNCGGFGGYL